jgi:hypothetical protein
MSGPGLQVTLNGKSMLLSNAIKLIGACIMGIVAFIWLQASVVAVQAQSEANALQNEIDKTTKVRVDYLEQAIMEQKVANGKILDNQTKIAEALGALRATTDRNSR